MSYKILIVCSGGMSSAMVVKSLVTAGDKAGLTIESKAIGTSEVEAELKNGWAMLLVAPQIRHRFDEFKALADQQGIPSVVIEAKGYSPLGGQFLIKQVQEALQL